jgi:DNA repair protein RecO (recombination protein O)
MSEARVPLTSRPEKDPAFVLHSYPYRETSLIVEVFCRQKGRMGLVARGARRPKSVLRGILLAFQPLEISWGGKSELKTLHEAEWRGGVAQLRGKPLICGFYMNELLLKLLAREDPHEGLFQHYDQAIRALAREADEVLPAIMRRFEKALLKELGYGLMLDREADGARVEPAMRYAYQVDRGPVRLSAGGAAAFELSGKTLLDLACDNYNDPVTQLQGRQLMRQIIGHHLGRQPLHTRQIMMELQQP